MHAGGTTNAQKAGGGGQVAGEGDPRCKEEGNQKGGHGWVDNCCCQIVTTIIFFEQ